MVKYGIGLMSSKIFDFNALLYIYKFIIFLCLSCFKLARVYKKGMCDQL